MVRNHHNGFNNPLYMDDLPPTYDQAVSPYKDNITVANEDANKTSDSPCPNRNERTSSATHGIGSVCDLPPQNSIKVTGFDPVFQKCRYCEKFVITKVKRRVGLATHIYALLTLGVLAPCIYSSSVFRDAEHYCPRCRGFLGKYFA